MDGEREAPGTRILHPSGGDGETTHEEEQDHREAKRKGSFKARSDYWCLEISYSIHCFRTHFNMTSDNQEIFTCVSV